MADMVKGTRIPSLVVLRFRLRGLGKGYCIYLGPAEFPVELLFFRSP